MKTKEAYKKAIEVLKLCKTRHGFEAAYPGYDAVWARDSMITSLGASLLGKQFKTTFKQSLLTLGRHQSHLGQIPNAVDKFSKRKPHVDFKSIDSSLWFIIGHYTYRNRFKDSSLFEKEKKKREKALTWLAYQDFGVNAMLEQQPTSDWQDAFPHRYGNTINTQALYYKVLKLTKNNRELKRLEESVNKNNDIKLWNGQFYDSYRWKNHNKYKEKSDWFDSLGNLLAIVFGLASNYQAKKILTHIEKNKINQPYPVKAIYPPITRKSKYWEDYYADSDAGKVFSYLNGGIWTFIGGFYILALIKQKQFKKAQQELEKLAEANMKRDGNFSEWLHGKTGRASEGGNQAWNAGMYVLAHDSLKKKRVLLL